MKNFIKEFKEFAMRGNVIDLAVGVVIGSAFGKIVSSLVTDIITPVLSLILGRVDLTTLAISIPAAMEGRKAIIITYGVFLQAVLDFIVIACSIFLMIKLINRLQKKKEETPPPPPQPSKEEILLTEIRDLLKEQNKKDT